MKLRLTFLFVLLLGLTQAAIVYPPDGSLQVYTDTPTHGLTISVNGYVGIGTANPTEKLDISGKIALDGVVIAYRPTSMDGTLILGDGGRNLSHSSGAEGYYNTFVGIGVGSSNTTGWRNAAMGTFALYSNTTGVYNSAMGTSALYSNTTGWRNAAMGTSALYSNTTGQYNAAMGGDALNYNTTGHSNAAMGNQALFYNTTGGGNSAMGTFALYSNTTGVYNSAIGTEAGYNALGNNNTFIGSYSDIQGGLSLNNATAIGYNAKVATRNALILGGLGADSVRVGIGTATPSTTLEVAGTISANSLIENATVIVGDTTLNSNFKTVLVNASPVTITLPDASTCLGRTFVIKKIDPSVQHVIINPISTDTIDGKDKYTLFMQYEFVSLISQSGGWYVLGNN